jgi:hypothetical protein
MKSFFRVEEFTIKQLEDFRSKGRLNVEASYQRNEVWNDHKKQLLIDTMVRGLPCGIVTLFMYHDPEKGKDIYEVIDGKQRLTTIFGYLRGSFVLPESIINQVPKVLDATDHEIVDEMEDDEDEALSVGVGQGSRSKYVNKTWKDLSEGVQDDFFEIKVPAFVVRSKQRDLAVDVFVRMNQNTVGLSPQEIRNAVFHDSELLQLAVRLAEAQTPGLQKNQPVDTIWWVSSGLISKASYPRMTDIEFMLEVLSMALHDNSPQHRRDCLDADCEDYAKPAGNRKAIFTQAEKTVTESFRKLMAIFPHGFVGASSVFKGARLPNDVYALLAALMKYEKSPAFIKSHQSTYVDAIIKLKEASLTYLDVRRSVKNITQKQADDRYRLSIIDENDHVVPDLFADLADRYASTFAGGQINGKTQRETRRDIWLNLLEGIAPVNKGPRNFTALQKHLIWEFSDKVCGRCHTPVQDRNNWDAGHIKAYSDGGETSIENGQVEHVTCNRAAGNR